jgi:hypothetical protein
MILNREIDLVIHVLRNLLEEFRFHEAAEEGVRRFSMRKTK